ncbi:Predicted unusual protein kinase regulating ubiquinone biosynthesis, AarF/ABC1/UbiB family [Pedococcus cremeus]|uniref:Predicted unusual protein kinase regulating ubiquinone biosynthesis, AarF/ABC1/UbiB family n=1 Tax=Pedococcus cremeus TaxID=587636 RepID=A0A1H9VRJ6_9MICO|nr:AarF/UbiB family protein [Pedococcus cremeus]SES24007.1 Predicted unusual protein kinase regulating ubiquinone biosynthesis, AarF/ABC1/UbiB family [Pedococcus cremeus]
MTPPLNPVLAGRYAALARLLVRHGRSDVVSGAGFDEFLVEQERPTGDVESAEELADDLERMGPTYIKLGQLLSTRVDLLPPAYTEALARLQDRVEPFPFEQAREIVEEELGVSIRNAFAEFDETPLAAASLGQVHRATLRSGREVVVKVQRPGIRETVRDDMQALTKLAEFADNHTDVGRRYGFGQLLAQFRRSLAAELDYQREAANLLRLRTLIRDHPHLHVPEPVADYTSSRVLTMDFVPGRKVTDVGPLGLLDVDGEPLVRDLFNAYLHMILVDGFLHADPHPGNVLLTPDGRLALLDLGMVATVPPRMQDSLVKLLLAIGDGDGDEAATVLATMGSPLEGYDAARFREDVAALVTRSVSMGGDVQAGAVLVELSRLSGTHGLRPPAEMAMVGKALLNLDQVTQHLDPAFAPAEAIRESVADIMSSGMRVSPSGIMAAAIDAKEFTANFPRRANKVMQSLAEGTFSVRVDAVDEARLLHVLQRLANRLTTGVVLAALVVGAALMMQVPTSSRILGYPAIAMVFFLLAAVGGAALVASILVTDRKIARQEGRARDPRL